MSSWTGSLPGSCSGMSTRQSAAWLRLRADLPVIASSSKRRGVTIGPYETRIVTSAVLTFGAWHAAADAHCEDVAALQAMGIGVSLDLMDDTTRGQLWVFDHIPASEGAVRAEVPCAPHPGNETQGKPCATPPTPT